ncbi:MFS transporter [Nguyenibacter vanlangensis]|uniref:MFS transporter n=1 Tax=Nguyenibacter vanlangensis TaxID=1216886 RepID=A0ABZ3D351_9PROT
MPEPVERGRSLPAIIAAACVGNFLEFYNFMAYAFFAPMIGHAFFPNGNRLISLLLSLMTFAVGFVLRPLGAVVIGRYARTHGQRPALMLTFAMMAAGSFLLAVTPSTRVIGTLAPVAVIIARLLQGFSDGGEVGPATALIFSAAPGRLGGVFGTLQYMTQLLGSLLAVLLGLVLSLVLSHDALYAWGWRVPFLAGLAILPVGLVLRRSAVAHQAAAPPPAGAVPGESPSGEFMSGEPASLWPVIPFVFLAITSITISTYLRNFGVSYAVSVLHLPPATAMTGMAAGLAAGVVGMLAGIFIAIRWPGRRTPFILVGLLTAAASLPLYYDAIHRPGLASQLALNIGMFLLASIMAVGIWQAMLEALGHRGRSFAFGIVYALAVSSFGGLTQPVTAWLIARTQDPMTPGYAMALVIPLGLLAYLRLHAIRRGQLEAHAAVPGLEASLPLVS